MKRARARHGTSAGHSRRSCAWPTAACWAGGFWMRAVAAGNIRCWPPPGARTWGGWTSRSGLFHVFDDADRAWYVTSLASVLVSGGTCFLMCFSDRQPGDIGPRRVRQEELRAAFSDGWAVTAIVAEAFEVNPGLGTPTAQAWLATI